MKKQKLYWPRRCSAVVRSSSALAGVLLLPGFYWAKVPGGFVPCPSAVVCSPLPRRVVSSPRPAVSSPSADIVRRVFSLGGSVPSGAEAAALSSWGASCSGSILLLSSPVFSSLVAAGRCPVALAFSAFSSAGRLSRWGRGGWPVRSACAGVLSLAGSVGAFSLVPHRELRSFLSEALPSLSLELVRPLSSPSAASAVLSFLWPHLSACWSGVVLPSPPSWLSSARFSRPALVSGLVSLSGGLRWLVSRGSCCPPAVRPFLACLCARVLRFLSAG